MKKTLMSLLVLCATSALAQAPPSEGYGSLATGGTGKPSCIVRTNVDECFKGGRINNLYVTFSSPVVQGPPGFRYIGNNVTLDGGPNGVTIQQPANGKRGIIVEGPASNVVVKNIRFEGSGPKAPGLSTEFDLFALDGDGGLVQNVLVDRCTFIGATDGALDITGSVADVTVQYSLIYNTPLAQLIKYGQRRRISLHHNVYTLNGERNPQVKGDMQDLDFVSNIVARQIITADFMNPPNRFSPYGLDLRNAGPGDSPGSIFANVKSSFFGGENSRLQISVESGASAAGIYIATDNVCASGCGNSPRATPNEVPSIFSVTPTVPSCMAVKMIPWVGAPNRQPSDTAALLGVQALLPSGGPCALPTPVPTPTPTPVPTPTPTPVPTPTPTPCPTCPKAVVSATCPSSIISGPTTEEDGSQKVVISTICTVTVK